MTKLSPTMIKALAKIGFAESEVAYCPRRTAQALDRRRLIQYAGHGFDLYRFTDHGKVWFEQRNKNVQNQLR